MISLSIVFALKGFQRSCHEMCPNCPFQEFVDGKAIETDTNVSFSSFKCGLSCTLVIVQTPLDFFQKLSQSVAVGELKTWRKQAGSIVNSLKYNLLFLKLELFILILIVVIVCHLNVVLDFGTAEIGVNQLVGVNWAVGTKLRIVGT